MDWNLRECQRIPVLDWARRQPDDFLAVITPGGGKTRLAAATAYGALDGGFVPRIAVNVPTTALKKQWTDEFAAAGIHLDPNYRTGARLSRDLHGIAVTYAQLCEDPDAFRRIFDNSLIFNDEIHHASVDSVWGKALEAASTKAKHRHHLSGTPFNTKYHKIAHLQYDSSGYVVADYVYSYRDALRDKIVRPIVAYPQGATVEWIGADGVKRTASFRERDLSEKHKLQRLRAVLEHPSWIAEALTRTHDLLKAVRRHERDAGALIACIDTKHARFVAEILNRTLGITPIVVVASDPESDENLTRFRHSDAPYIVAVRKVFEGVDIPRLRVEAYFTNAMTEMFFRQITGRIIRARGNDVRPGYLVYPADDTLDELVNELTNDVKGYGEDHFGAANLADTGDDDDGAGGGRTPLEVLSAAHEDLPPIITYETVNPDDVIEHETRRHEREEPTIPRAEEHKRLRTVLAAIATDVARRFSIEKHDVYSFWAKSRGSIETADTKELQTRINTMRGWLDNGRCPVQRKQRSRS